jgi:hypothetical protein
MTFRFSLFGTNGFINASFLFYNILTSSLLFNQNETKHILLQNENGPCPLLAAANALLLKGMLTLPQKIIRANVASIDDIINLLAERALKGQSNNPDSSHHIDDLLQLFPALQFGMDVNPKFTLGCCAYEFTRGLSAFDLMGVELVHGWLIDAQDELNGSVVGSKTYNELTSVIITGKEASGEIAKIERRIEELERESADKVEGIETTFEQEVSPITNTKELTEQGMDKLAITESGDTDDRDDSIETQFVDLKTELGKQTKLFQDGTVVEEFLFNTSMQLTYYGLMELHNHVQEGSMCVFFRNNHFATLTKHNGTLYLLVTDLGYANVPDVVWEKLDDINGDTEYADQDFVKTKPQANVNAANGPSLSPEQLLAQSSITDADYQLALQISRNENAINEQEGKMIAAATAASLEGLTLESGIDSGDLPAGIVNDNVPVSSMELAREEEDRLVAMQLQAKYEEDDGRDRLLRDERARQPRPQTRREHGKKDKDGCAIS